MARAKPKANAKGRGKKASAKPKPKTDAQSKLTIKQLERDIAAAEAEHRRLVLSEATDYAHLRATHLAARLLWSLRADLCYRRGLHDGARKASTTADEHAKMAVRLDANNVVDRVAALERELAVSQSLQRELADLE